MNIIILAVTRKNNGICIAGINDKLEWIRPIKNRILNVNDIKLNKKYLSISNSYEFSFSKHVPSAPQTENYLIDETKPIIHVKTLAEDDRRALFQSLQENSLITSNSPSNISTILKSDKRSLIFLGPVTIDSVYMRFENSYMKSPRVTCTINSLPIKNQKGNSDLSCTDLKFRAFAKDLLKKKKLNSLTLTGTQLQELLGFKQVFVAIGLTGEFRDEYWPMIIGIHTIPDYKQEINYDDL